MTSRPTSPHRRPIKGAAVYACALAALMRRPMQREELSRELGLNRTFGYSVAEDLYAMGLVDVVRDGYGKTFAGKNLELPAIDVEPKATRAWAKNFGTIYNALATMGPISRAEIQEHTGAHLKVIRLVLSALRDENLARIARWEPGAYTGPLTELWALGDAPDASPVRRSKAATDRAYREGMNAKRQQLAILSALRPSLIREAA